MKIIQNVPISVLLVMGLWLQNCASTGAQRGNAEIYDQEFNKMIEVVEQAVAASNLNIDHISESDETQVTLMISQSKFLGNRKVQQNRGEVRIFKIDENKTRITIANPEYHFSVPEHQKENYRSIINSRIKNILDG